MNQKIKYLYGEKSNLLDFYQHGGPLWFRDIYTLNMLENNLICDDESNKSFNIGSKHIKRFTIDGKEYKLFPNSKFKIHQPTRRCHVLCLSNSGFNSELFQRFNADICIAINVELMIQAIKDGNKNIEVIGRNVEYFKHDKFPDSLDTKELVFIKDFEKYNIEDEYRIAVFWPCDNKTKIETECGNFINLFGEKPSIDNHIEFTFEGSDLTDLIIKAQDNKKLYY